MISASLARVIAKVSGDGHLGKKQIMYFNKCPELINEFKLDIATAFENPNFSEGFMANKIPYVVVYGKKNIHKLKNYLPSYNSFDIFIPDEIISSPLNIINEFIRTFYDDEGCVSLRLNRKTQEWKRSVTISSNSYKILLQIKAVLKRYNIVTNKIIRNNPNSSRDQSFVLAVTGKENLSRFQGVIKFKHPRKIKMLDLIMESYEATPKNKARFLKLKEKLDRMMITKK